MSFSWPSNRTRPRPLPSLDGPVTRLKSGMFAVELLDAEVVVGRFNAIKGLLTAL